MTHDQAGSTYQAEGDFQHLPSEEVEIRAIEDATAGRLALFTDDAADTEQAVEYREKRQLAIDEEVNADPSAG